MIRFLIPIFVASGLMAAPLTAQAQDLAKDGLKQTISLLSEDPSANGFQLGMLQSLRAIEKTLQTRFDYGLGQSFLEIPVLRLGMGGLANPTPKEAGPDTLSAIVKAFADDIALARTTLEDAAIVGVEPFDLTLENLWFDINLNDARDRGEAAIELLTPFVLGQRRGSEYLRSQNDKSPLAVRFDHADHAWLTAYNYMLSGFGNLYLAFDPEPVLRDLASGQITLENAPEIPNVYDVGVLTRQIAELEAEQAEIKIQQKDIQARLQPLRENQRVLAKERRDTDDAARKAEIVSEINSLREEQAPLEDHQRDINQANRLIQNEINSVKAKLPNATSPVQQMAESQRDPINLIYTIIAALEQQPDPDHIQAAYDDWRAMIKHNRTFWALLDEETDNDREWIPNARQTSALPLDVPPRVAEGWRSILADADSVLNGTLLIPHPLLPQGHGISLPAYVENPSPLKVADWLHGIGAYPYVAKGPRITAQSWQAFQRMTRGNAGGFALFFN